MQPRAEVEQLDLFRVVLAREHDLEIREHPPVGAAPLEGAEPLARELRLGDEHRQPRDHEDRDGPRREREQQARVAHERDAVLRERERAIHERSSGRTDASWRARFSLS